MSGKPYFLKIFLFIACVAILTTGCRKLIDYISNHGDGDYKACNIKKLTAYNYSPFDTLKTHVDTVVYNFVYNRLGDPISITGNHPGTGNPNFLFYYDRYNRLISMVQPYAGATGYENFDRYGYNDKGQIVKDTGYAFGLITGGVAQPTPNVLYATYEYDAKGRIIHEVDSVYQETTFRFAFSRDYNYDVNGDLISGATYDNKLNVLRTNSVWMFIRKDYSLHNPFTATQYNENELPLSLIGQVKLIPSAGPGIHIEYMCH